MHQRTSFVHALALISLAGAAASAQSGALATVSDNGDQFVKHNGTVYRVEKSMVDGAPVRVFRGPDGVYTSDALRAKVAGETPKVLSDDAAALAAGTRADETVELAVLLRPQPASPISRDERSRIDADFATLSNAVLGVTRRFVPDEPVRPELEREWVMPLIPREALEERRVLSAALDTMIDGARRRTAERIHEANLPHQQAFEAFVVGQLGGEVYARTTHGMSVMFVRVPAGSVDQLAAHELVAAIDVDHPGAPELDNMAISLGLPTGFWANGITGGIHDVGVLDTGVAQNHPFLSSHNFMSNMGVSDTGSHGTGMAGIIASTHPTWRGMSYGIDTIVVSRAGSIGTSMPGMNYIASTGVPESVNYSFGNGTASTNDYTLTDQFFDGTVDTFGIMVSKSAGNGGYGSVNPTITHPAPAYNLMATANMDDFNNTNRATHRITSSSSRGPTALGRKKPDITAPGNNSYSTSPNGSFANIGGTSSAAPKVSAGIVLLWDAGVTSVMAGKALLINTADAMNDNGTSTTADDAYVDGSLWNRRYGWGYMNLGRAYMHAGNSFLGEVTGRPGAQPFRLYAGPMFQYDKATLVWERNVAYNGATYPTQIESLSDLDLFAYRELNNALLASSISAIDNVEQLHSPSDQASVVLKVASFDPLDPDIDSEPFALAAQQGFSVRTGPAFQAAIAAPGPVDPGVAFTLSIVVENTGDLAAHSLSASLDGGDLVLLSEPSPSTIPSIPAGESIVLEWQAIAPTEGSYTLSLAIGSDSYGEQFGSAVVIGLVVDGCPGDATGDGVVNFADLNLVLEAFGATGAPGSLAGDLNNDGAVNFGDLNIVLANFGLRCE